MRTLVRVKRLGEILATLDSDWRVDGLIFMPEMEQFCGSTQRVLSEITKLCDPTLPNEFFVPKNVFSLDIDRCDGSRHGGCEAKCMMLWSGEWLEFLPEIADVKCSATNLARTEISHEIRPCQVFSFRGVEHLRSVASAQRNNNDVISRRQHGAFVKLKAAGESILQKIGDGFAHAIRVASGVNSSCILGKIFKLRRGDYVRVRSLQEIRLTLDAAGKNYGLSFEDEMQVYCETVQRVAENVRRIISPKSGELVSATRSHPLIRLENVACSGASHAGCQRRDFFLWREVWLDRC